MDIKRIELTYPERRALLRAMAPDMRFIRADSLSLVILDECEQAVLEFWIDEEKANQYLEDVD